MGNIKSKSIILGAVVALTGSFLFSNIFFSHSAYAASYINVSSGSGGTVSFGSIKPTSTGTSATASDTLTVHTDCSVGYSVYVSGQNGKDTNLTNKTASSDNVISTSSNAIGSAGSLNSNTWGLNYENTGTYVGLPTYAEATNTALTTKTSVDEESTVPIYYGIKVDTSITPGTYTGDVLYTVLPNSACSMYTIRFNANGGAGEMSNQTMIAGAATNLMMNTFTRSGYMFVGWSTDPSAATATYTDGQSVTDIGSFGSILNLYAIWGQSTGTMQDFQCATLASGTTTYLADARDNQVYRVYRIPTDQTYAGTSTTANVAGKCLMTRDLNLGAVDSASDASSTIVANKDMTLSPNDSGFTTPTGSGESITVPTDSVTVSPTVAYTQKYSNRWYKANGTGDYAGRGYYSWGAAMVACPKNWRLPTADEYSDSEDYEGQTIGLAAVVKGSDATETISNITSSPYFSVLGGNYFDNSQYASSLLIWQPDGLRRQSNYKYNGFVVRCLAEDNYIVSYSSTGADGGNPSKTSEVAYESGSVTMPTAGTLVKDGYEFKGWALTSGAATATYQAEETVTLSDLLTAASSAGQTATAGSTITLYPVWIHTPSGTMQSWTGCASLATNGIVYLKDGRDDNVYAVKKLPDGKCWMVQNLRLVGERTLTPSDSNVSSDFTLTASTDPSITNWCVTDSEDCDNKIQVFYDPSQAADSKKSSYYGALYNWYTATAGTGTYSTASGDVSSSICPKGWRLPKGGSDKATNDFSILDIAWGGTGENRTDANTYDIFIGDYLSGDNGNFELGGYLYRSGVNSVGHESFSWSTTAYSDGKAYFLNVYEYGPRRVLTQSGHNKYRGFSVRCIKDTRTITDITYMQDINSTIVANTATNAYAQLTDSRDNNKYYVKKLADGKLWMVQNLKLVDYKLTSADSDVSSDFTLTASVDSSSWCQKDDCDQAMVYYDPDKASTTTDASYYGALYNWYAATAGTGKYETDSGNATSSICPKGWRLPTGENGGDFATLDIAWGGNGSDRHNANTYSTFTEAYTSGDNGGFGLAGWVADSVGYAGSRGYYWSSTASPTYRWAARHLRLLLNGKYVYPMSDGYGKHMGFSVRCIAR